MNPYLKVFAVNQPITQVIEAVRALMLGRPIGNYGWLAAAWSVGILVVAVPLASWLFRRRTSN
jgi:ABC-2 type transport system permease protein